MTKPQQEEHHDHPIDKETLEEISRGMMLASLAITDNNEGTLKKVGKANPWHIEALKLITGSEERAHKPLRDILYDDMNGLVVDTMIDVSGVTKGGHFLDTQGYIAHNDDIIVVAFRCTTSVFDWMTNFNSSSSVWEVENDLRDGFSGFCSGLEGFCCNGGQPRPRVHTGFYNNFLASWPTIKQYVEPYLSTGQRARTLYVVGHSLGAGIANLTASHFLMSYNWEELPQRLVLITAGSPRSICKSMKVVVDEQLQRYGPDNVRFHRIVKGSDAVTCVPPKLFGFEHMTPATVITDDGTIVVRLDGENDTTVKQFVQLKEQQENAVRAVNVTSVDDGGGVDGRDDTNEDGSDLANDDNATDVKTKYDRLVTRIPKALRDHMPDFYLKPIFKAQGIKIGTSRPIDDITQIMSDDEGEQHAGAETGKGMKKNSRKRSRKWIPRVFRRNHAPDAVEGTYF